MNIRRSTRYEVKCSGKNPCRGENAIGGSVVLCFPERQHDLRDEMLGVTALGRTFQINAPHRARRCQAVLPGAGEQLLYHGGQLLIRPVVVDAERLRGGQDLHILTLALRGMATQKEISSGRRTWDSTRYIR